MLKPHKYRMPILSAPAFTELCSYPAGAPNLLQAAGLRLLCGMWTKTGRGFNHVRTVVLSVGLESSLELRAARAQNLLDICTRDGGRGAEFVAAIQVPRSLREWVSVWVGQEGGIR